MEMNSEQIRRAMHGPLGRIVMRRLRTEPLQTRSKDGIAKLLAVAIRHVWHQRTADPPSLTLIAKDAGMTPQAVYRYFEDGDRLVDVAYACFAVVEYHQVLQSIVDADVHSVHGLSNAVVVPVLLSYGRFHRMANKKKENMVRSYRNLCDEASDIIIMRLFESMISERLRILVEPHQIKAALSSAVATAGTVSAERLEISRAEVELMLRASVLTVIGAGAQPNFGALSGNGATLGHEPRNQIQA